MWPTYMWALTIQSAMKWSFTVKLFWTVLGAFVFGITGSPIKMNTVPSTLTRPAQPRIYTVQGSESWDSAISIRAPTVPVQKVGHSLLAVSGFPPPFWFNQQLRYGDLTARGTAGGLNGVACHGTLAFVGRRRKERKEKIRPLLTSIARALRCSNTDKASPHPHSTFKPSTELLWCITTKAFPWSEWL